MTEIKTDPRAHDQLEAGLASEHGPNIIQMADYPPGYDRFMVLEPGTNNQNNMYTDDFSQRQNHTNHTESPASGDMGKDDHPQANDGTTSVTPLEQTTDEEAYLTGFALASILLGITLAYFLVFLDMAVISTATPAITTTFDSLVDVGWYGGAYQLGTAALQPLSGKIYTHFSTKWSLISFFVVFEIGSAICGAAHSSAMFIAGRTIAGMGASGLGAGCMTIISCILPPSKQPAVMGVNIGLAQVGLAIGPIIGGAFTSNSSATWRWCFYLNLPLGAIIGPAILFHTIPENKPKLPALEVLRNRETIKSLDLMGFALISPAAIMLFLGLQFGGNSHPWNSSTVIGLLVGAFVTFGVFLAWEYRQGDEAMVPFAMLRHKIIWSAAATAALNVSSILIADFYVAIYFQVVHNDSPIMSAVHMLPMTLGVVLFTMTSGGLTSALGYYLPWMVAGTSLSAIGYGLLSELSPTTPVARWIGNQVLYGIGGGCTAVGPVIAIQSLVPKEQVPIAMSILIFSQNLGGAVFLIVANAIFNNVLRQQLQERISTIGISPDTIINAGARSVRALVPSGPALAAVVQSYSNSIDRVMYLGVALAVGGFVFCWGLGFKNVKKLGKLEAITDKPKEQSAESVQPKSQP